MMFFLLPVWVKCKNLFHDLYLFNTPIYYGLKYPHYIHWEHYHTLLPPNLRKTQEEKVYSVHPYFYFFHFFLCFKILCSIIYVYRLSRAILSGLLEVTNLCRYPSSENVLISPSFLKVISYLYEVLSRQLFYLLEGNVLLLLVFMLYGEKSIN